MIADIVRVDNKRILNFVVRMKMLKEPSMGKDIFQDGFRRM